MSAECAGDSACYTLTFVTAASGPLALQLRRNLGWKDSGCNAGGETVEGTTLLRPQVAGVALIFGGKEPSRGVVSPVEDFFW